MTTSTCSATAAALPSAIHAMPQRRSFLAGLAALPLIGGSVALLGRPSAVAEPVTMAMLEAYRTWLHYERRLLAWEMAKLPEVADWYGGTHRERYDIMDRTVMHIGAGDAPRFHRYDGSSPASARAAVVLSAVGCDWRDGEARQQKRRA